MTLTYWNAPEVEAIGKRLIDTHHRHLSRLAASELHFIFRSEAAKAKGKTVLGKARKVTGLNAFLACEFAPSVQEEAGEPDPIFVIEIAYDMWENLSDKQRIALIDHELCHCDIQTSQEGVPTKVIKPHDLEEFTCIVERHGLWKADVGDFLRRGVAANPTLFDLVDEETGQIDPVVPPAAPEGQNDGAAPDNVTPMRARRPKDAQGQAQAAPLALDPVGMAAGMATTGMSGSMSFGGITVPFGNGTTVTPPANVDPGAGDPVPKTPHDLSSLQGLPCSQDEAGEYDHRGCEEEAAAHTTIPSEETSGADVPNDDETVFNPAQERDGVRRIPQERPQRAPKPDHSGRDPEGPKTAHFDPDDIPDADIVAAAGSAGPRVAGKVEGGRRKDETLKRFLDS